MLTVERAAVAPKVPVSYTHLRAHETVLDLVCRLLLEKKKLKTSTYVDYDQNFGIAALTSTAVS